MQQLQVSRDDLVEVIQQMTHDLIRNESYSERLWELLQLQYLISNLYVREE